MMWHAPTRSRVGLTGSEEQIAAVAGHIGVELPSAGLLRIPAELRKDIAGDQPFAHQHADIEGNRRGILALLRRQGLDEVLEEVDAKGDMARFVTLN